MKKTESSVDDIYLQVTGESGPVLLTYCIEEIAFFHRESIFFGASLFLQFFLSREEKKIYHVKKRKFPIGYIYSSTENRWMVQQLVKSGFWIEFL